LPEPLPVVGEGVPPDPVQLVLDGGLSPPGVVDPSSVDAGTVDAGAPIGARSRGPPELMREHLVEDGVKGPDAGGDQSVDPLPVVWVNRPSTRPPGPEAPGGGQSLDERRGRVSSIRPAPTPRVRRSSGRNAACRR
jgi:hypothetical protein